MLPKLQAVYTNRASAGRYSWMVILINRELPMSDCEHFRVGYEINPYMDTGDQPDVRVAIAEHDAIVRAHQAAGRRVLGVSFAWECPDMVYTANAAVIRGGRAVLGSPPSERKVEISYFRDWLEKYGLEVLDAPYSFSGLEADGERGSNSPWGWSLRATSDRIGCPIRRTCGVSADLGRTGGCPLSPATT